MTTIDNTVLSQLIRFQVRQLRVEYAGILITSVVLCSWAPNSRNFPVEPKLIRDSHKLKGRTERQKGLQKSIFRPTGLMHR
jgi:hypothetical protein